MTSLVVLLNRDVWGPIWPNLAASALTFTVGILWARRKLLVEMERRERAHFVHHRETQQSVQALHNRLDAIGVPPDATLPADGGRDDNLRT